MDVPTNNSSNERGSGRTFELIASVPDGGVFVVHSREFIPYVQEILTGQGRSPHAIQIISMSNIGRLIGSPCHVGVDHYVYECPSITQQAKDDIREIAENMNKSALV